MYHTKCTGKFSKKPRQTIQQKESRDSLKAQLTGPAAAPRGQEQYLDTRLKHRIHYTIYTTIQRSAIPLWSKPGTLQHEVGSVQTICSWKRLLHAEQGTMSKGMKWSTLNQNQDTARSPRLPSLTVSSC